MSSPAIMRQMWPTDARPVTVATPRGEFATLQAEPDAASGTVLLVPGYTGSKEDFAPLYDPLRDAGLRVVGIDQRGQFETPGTSDAAAYTVDALGADIVAIADALPSPVHLVGHSFGGLTTRAAAIASPSAFASLTLMSTGPDRLPDGPRRSIITAAREHLHTAGLATIYDLGQQRLAADPTWVPPPDELRSFLRRRFVSSSADALLHQGDAMLAEPDRVAELQAVGLPTLVIYGEHDNAWSPQAQAQMAGQLGAAHCVIPFALHSPALENPEATVEALLAFWGR